MLTDIKQQRQLLCYIIEHKYCMEWGKEAMNIQIMWRSKEWTCTFTSSKTENKAYTREGKKKYLLYWAYMT